MSKSLQNPSSGSVEKKVRGVADSTAHGQQAGVRQQSESFDRAVRLFHAGKFQDAVLIFEQVATGPVREVAHAASLHARMCRRRIEVPHLELKTPDDHYNYAIALINQRNLAPAEAHLREALGQAPDADHLYYALALCRGLGGDLNGAWSNLKRAIVLQPRNAVLARNDPDFAELARQSPLRELLHSEKTHPA
jgi:tetratricopeptide (TPR) repeat protein